ncbi:hypothetical protein A0J61_06772 [Choanephora cucurbitarum]|uniref:Oxidoreductase-like domain-containing protein n=1 Tax=Choanephora cucurbitarum TaxID=101091 RepID=A0A1C7N7V2_9FUNG|nr:hypothetical protein A0J61_06772 [Choanephora cucurbitarum]
MSRLFIRSLSYRRTPHYNGWWDLILNKASLPTAMATERMPLSIPFEAIEPTQTATTTAVASQSNVVYLKGKQIQLPQKPASPDNCCMSGCVHCVWDLYQEDMEEYNEKKREIRDQFKEAGEPLPPELQKRQDDQAEEMDPTMKAFLEMEKKLKR